MALAFGRFLPVMIDRYRLADSLDFKHELPTAVVIIPQLTFTSFLCNHVSSHASPFKGLKYAANLQSSDFGFAEHNRCIFAKGAVLLRHPF